MTEPMQTEEMAKSYAASMNAAMERTDKLIETARPSSVFAEPVTVEGRTIIGAAEVLAWAGFGGGSGSAPSSGEGESAPVGGSGMGVGGGGFATSRPVAVVIIEPGGARVEPVVDVTKLGLAALTALGSMAFFLGRMIRGGNRAA